MMMLMITMVQYFYFYVLSWVARAGRMLGEFEFVSKTS